MQRQLKMELGFRTAARGVQTDLAPETPETTAEAAMLTGDLNVAVVEWIVQYRIRTRAATSSTCATCRSTFRDMSEAAMRQVVGDHSVDEVLTIGREAIALQAKQQLQASATSTASASRCSSSSSRT